MPINIRPRGANTFELRITHRLLPKPFYKNFPSQLEAEQLAARLTAMLDQGVVPDDLKKGRSSEIPTISSVINAYLSVAAVSSNTEDVLNLVDRQVGSVPLSALTWEWVEEWITRMKVTHHLAPGTIRKRKAALSTVLNWVCRTRPLWLARNPLVDLPRGYSGYDRKSREILALDGVDIPHDVVRERRVDPPEEAAIIGILRARIEAAGENLTERANAEGLLLMFQLALETAMRMRELYSVTLEQVSYTNNTIYLKKTKNGSSRQVPLSPAALALLKAPWPGLEAARTQGRLFPFWDGRIDPKNLKETTSMVSKMFSKVFREAGCPDLHFHDCRHEAVCRWVLKSAVTDAFLARAAGMTDARTRSRYLSLRGGELAAQLSSSPGQ
jgi:integrase